MRVSVNIQLQICLFESPLGKIIKDQLVKSLKNEQGHTSKFFPLTQKLEPRCTSQRITTQECRRTA